MYKFLTVTIIFFVVNVSDINAQEMSLDDCIKYGIKHNLLFANKQIETEIYNENYQQSKRDLLPSVNADGSSSMFFGKSIDPTTNDFVNKQLFSMTFSVSSQMSLFSGFRKWNTIKYNKIKYLMSRENLLQYEIDLSFQIMNSYYDVVYYKNLVEIVREQIKLSELSLKKTEKLIETGLKAESDLLEMKAQTIAEKYNMLSAENKLNSAVILLKKHMNYSVKDTIVINEKQDLLFVKREVNADQLFNEAINHMPIVKNAKLELEASEKNINIARGALYPSLSLGGYYSTNYADSRKEKVYPLDNSNNEMRTIDFKNQFSQNASQTVFLRLNIPIFNKWANRSNVKKAKLEKQMADNKQKETLKNLYEQITDDTQKLNALQQETEQLEAQANALSEVYAIANKKLEQGIVSVIEFYAAKNQLAKAKADLLRTKTQLIIKQKTISIYLNKY